MSNLNQNCLHSTHFHLVIIAEQENAAEIEQEQISLKSMDLQVCICGLISVKFY